MNDIRVNQNAAGLLVPLETLINPAYRHRYFDEKGEMLPAIEINKNELFWKSVPPPKPLGARKSDPMW